MQLSQYKPERRFVPTRTIAETLRVIKPGNLISLTTEEGAIFAKVQTVEPTFLIVQKLRHNFEPLDEIKKIVLSKIVSIKQVSMKHGMGAIKNSGSMLLA